MAIRYLLDAQGGFTVGDTASRMTSYAYPTSACAQQAKRAPAKVAAFMLKGQARHPGAMWEADYDARNWAKLGEETPDGKFVSAVTDAARKAV